MKMMDLLFNQFPPELIAYRNTLMTRAMNVVGDYIESEIRLVGILNPLSQTHICNAPYVGKIRAELMTFGNSLNNAEQDSPNISNEKDWFLKAMSENYLLNAFINLIESLFTVEQILVMTQFNTPKTPPNPLPVVSHPPPYVYIPYKIGSQLMILGNYPPLWLNTVDQWIQNQYKNYCS